MTAEKVAVLGYRRTRRREIHDDDLTYRRQKCREWISDTTLQELNASELLTLGEKREMQSTHIHFHALPKTHALCF